MNLVLLFDQDFKNDSRLVELTGRRAEHIHSIHRVKIGDVLNVGLRNGPMGKGEITEVSKKKVVMNVDFSAEIQSPPPLPVNLIVALPRPQSLKKVIQCSVSMGIKSIYLINANKVEKSYWQSTLLKDNNLDEHVILGLEQGKDTVMPEIHFKKYFKPFVQEELPELIKGTLPIIAHPGKEDCPHNVTGPVTLTIGPEGGFTEYEIDKFMDIGFKAVNLGERILRVEYAIPFISGKLF